MEVQAMTYFKNVNTLEELRRQYKELLKKFHPDNANGSTEATQEINAEYDRLFKILKDKHESQTETNTDNNQSYDHMRWDEAEDEMLRDILSKVINLSNVTIEIIGAWIWIGGNTYSCRKELKELGFKFAGSKKMWYWKSEIYQKKSHKKLSIDDIRNYYGSTEVHSVQRRLLKEA